MKPQGVVLFFLLMAGAPVIDSCCFLVPGYAHTVRTLGASIHLFDYDRSQTLNIQDRVIEDNDELAIHDISYESPKGGRVSAYLVVPKGKGPFAGVLFGHYGLGTRSEFIPEAKLYAKAGAVSLIPDYPWDRAQPWRKSIDNFDKPELDRETYIQAVIDLRRGIDLLLARNDVDSKRRRTSGTASAHSGAAFSRQWISVREP
jgi:cephalosporin-C deacetylase-like acetyl esterase